MIEETVPAKLLGLYGGYYAMTFGLAYSFTNIELLMFVLAPNKTKIRIIFGQPIFLFGLQLILQYTYFKNDTVKHLLTEDKMTEAYEEVQKIYLPSTPENADKEHRQIF